MFAYRKLNVYQMVLQWVLCVYELCTSFPRFVKFALSSQVRCVAISGFSNITEGMSRSFNMEILQFLEIRFGFLMEVYSQSEIAQLLNYITKEKSDDIDPMTEEIAMMLSGMKMSMLR